MDYHVPTYITVVTKEAQVCTSCEKLFSNLSNNKCPECNSYLVNLDSILRFYEKERYKWK